MGHLTLISEDVISAFSHYPLELKEQLSQYAPQPEWDQYVSGRFQETKERDTSQLGGGKPVVLPGQIPLRPGLGPGVASKAGMLAIDEGDGLALKDTGTFTRIGMPNGTTPVQNVVFASTNEEDDDAVPTGQVNTVPNFNILSADPLVSSLDTWCSRLAQRRAPNSSLRHLITLTMMMTLTGSVVHRKLVTSTYPQVTSPQVLRIHSLSEANESSDQPLM